MDLFEQVKRKRSQNLSSEIEFSEKMVLPDLNQEDLQLKRGDMSPNESLNIMIVNDEFI